MTILRRAGTPLDGSNPALLTGYGGYGNSRRPGFDADRRILLDRGFVIAVANLRGRRRVRRRLAPPGESHRKQNVFDDFLACAEELIAAGYTNPMRLAIEGGSNGGLLMGAALTQRPGLFRAVVAHVGIFDMLRVEGTPNGLFNTTEFGSVKDPEQFRALHAYSPYHRVADGTAFPAVLFLTGKNDPRVDPWQSRKMVARLQAATSCGAPVLLRTSAHSGHGIGSPLSERAAQEADVVASSWTGSASPTAPPNGGDAPPAGVNRGGTLLRPGLAEPKRHGGREEA